MHPHAMLTSFTRTRPPGPIPMELTPRWRTGERFRLVCGATSPYGRDIVDSGSMGASDAVPRAVLW